MEAKKVLYAAVGAPVVTARKVSDRVTDWREQMSKETAGYSSAAEKAIEGWAAEGQKVVERIGSGNVVEEISSKVDLGQAKEQVGKLRDQLEDMLDTWRTSFRPEGPETVPAKKQPAKSPAAKKPAAKSPATGSSTEKSSTAKGSTAKSSTAKSSTAQSA